MAKILKNSVEWFLYTHIKSKIRGIKIHKWNAKTLFVVLADISANFADAENFIAELLEDICSRVKTN